MKTIWWIIAALLLVGTMSFVGSGTAQASTPQWLSVSAGNEHTCAIATNHALYCWGYNDKGQLGLGDTDSRDTPKKVGTSTNWTSVTTGYQHTCALNSSGSLYCWGVNNTGQLGVGDTTNRKTPTKVG